MCFCPAVLVAVSPTVGVDVAARESLLGVIPAARDAGTAVLLVSDDLEDLRICTRLLVMVKGSLVQEHREPPWDSHELIVGAFVNPSFLTEANFINVAQQSAALGAVVVAETLILLTGKFDLSLQSIYGLAPMVGAWLIVGTDGQGLGTNWNPFLGIAIVLLIGMVVGAINGFAVIKLGFNAFIFTLAMLILLAGIQNGIVNGRTVYHLPDEFIYLGSQYWLGVPVSVWVTGAIFLLAVLFLRYHRVGRAIYAIGGNTEAARAAGIHVDRIRIGVFIVAGLLAVLAGLMTAGEVVAVTASQGNNLIFQVFAAAVIGGISLEGGRGRMVGALTGVILLALVQNILILSQVQTFWIDAANGLIILIALGLARLIGTERS